jgi:hypothetical protein
MKLGFLITSAINTRFGVFDTSTRLQQTLDTVASIKSRCKDPHITLIEMAAIPLTDEQRAILKSHAHVLIEFANDDVVKQISKSDNWDIVKNMTEMFCFRHALKLMQGSDFYKDIDRFVKVSGRYKLNTDFKESVMKKAGDRVVFASRRKSQFQPHVTKGVTEQFMSRCWSFPAKDLESVEKMYEAMLNHMQQVLGQGGYIDIEHLLFTYSTLFALYEVKKIGVEGNIGPNGALVRD